MSSPILRPTRLLRLTLAAALAVGLAAAPQAQAPVDADEPGAPAAAAAFAVEAPATQADDHDPGAARRVAATPLPTGFVSDLDADADAMLFAGPGADVFARSAGPLDDGRDGMVALASGLSKPYDGPLDDGRDGTVLASRFASVPYDGPLDDGRPEGSRRSVVTPDAPVQPEVASAAPAQTTAAEGLTLSLVSPNPALDRADVSFELSTAGPATVHVFDVQGRQVAVAYEGFVPAESRISVALDVTGLAPGTYVAVLSSSGARTSQTFQVVR